MSDGTSASITAPNGSAQKKLIEKALQSSIHNPSDVDYIESHGTGTALGDPIEVEALAEVFDTSRSQTSPLFVGGVKANIGHLECAAGIAGLIKTSLMLGHRCALPNPALGTLNPLIKKIIDSKEFAVMFSSTSESLSSSANKLLVAGVSSFGYSGTISHTILQQAPKHGRWDIELQEVEDVNQDGGAAVKLPNRIYLPWPESLLHPLLQQNISQLKSCEFETIFHDRLIDFFLDHFTSGGIIFPVAAYVEMGLAAGSTVWSKGTRVELLDIKSVHTLNIKAGDKIISTHHFGSGMQFVHLSPESSNETTVASISKINVNPVLFTPEESLMDLKMRHTRKIELALENSCHGVYQTIQSVNLADNGTSALAQIGLPIDSLHEHNTYYNVHPALLHSATFRLLSLLSDLDGGNWTATGISRAVMHSSSNPAWAHLVIIEDKLNIKSC